MLPPVMDVVVVWHPRDQDGRALAEALVEHFHGTAYSGLIGGAVEVYVRSAPWLGPGSAPRPIAYPEPGAGGDAGDAPHLAVVPVISRALANAVSDGRAWAEYMEEIAAAREAHPERVVVLPLLTSQNVGGSRLSQMFGRWQWTGPVTEDDAQRVGWRRNLVQGLAQFVREPGSRIQVFISHTRQSVQPSSSVLALTQLVRDTINNDSRLSAFFDAHDLQPGEDWAAALREAAGNAALLALRSDLYSSRAWCQEEVLTAKRQGVPVVIVDALEVGEDRGSFLMDHVPRLPARREGQDWSKDDVDLALGLLVDEALKRALWIRQRELVEQTGAVDVAWWAPHAPEPVTLAAWLDEQGEAVKGEEGAPLVVLHPDPPLGRPELTVLNQIARLAGVRRDVEIVTPRQLAARAG
jgi:hypothetical protein